MITTDPATASRAAALFVSYLSAGDRPTPAAVEAAIKHALLTHGGTNGCAADVAAAFGDYPETAVARMVWARGLVANVPALANAA